MTQQMIERREKNETTEGDRMSETAVQQSEKAPERDTPYSAVMKTWARWMHLDDKPHPTGEANPQDVKEFMACGEAVDVMVNDLPMHQRWAVRKAYGIATQWRFPEVSFEDALLAAEAILTLKMLRNVATRRYFH